MRFKCGNLGIDFSIESIRKNYQEKDAFFSDMISVYGDGKELKKIVNKVWEITFPKEEG